MKTEYFDHVIRSPRYILMQNIFMGTEEEKRKIEQRLSRLLLH